MLNAKAGWLKNKKQALITKAGSRHMERAGKNRKSGQGQIPENKEVIQMTKLITNWFGIGRKSSAGQGNKHRQPDN